MTVELRLSRAAFRQIDAADSWWRENRPANPELFMTELRSTLTRIQRLPNVFAEINEPRLPGLRRLLMPRSRYYVYWTTSDDAVEVLAVWHTSRGMSPLDDDENSP